MIETISEAAAHDERRKTEATPGSLFAEVCKRFGERTAVSLGAESATYAELNARAGQVAAGLQAEGVMPGTIVAIYLERSIDLVASMLGVIQAGAAYLPIDASYPEARVLETLSDAMPAAVVTSHALKARLGHAEVKAILLEELADAPMVPPHACSADDLAYVIYTSGSTGKPKGVMVSHRNVTRLLSQTEPWFHFNEHDVWTMFHSFAFDFSVWEMWGCLLNGGRLVLVPFEVSRSPEDFYALISAEGVTVLNQTPSALSLLIQTEGRGPRLPLALRTVILGGEALNLRSLLPWFERHGDETPTIINMYGITETTVHVTYRRITAIDAERETESLIGEPIPDLRIDLLDDQLRPVAEGETGEMCIGGQGVAMGYLRRPELTAERFVADTSGEDGARLYRSGDLARRRPDGELVYLGRADRQVKINGFRIELGEIEAALMSFPGLTQACVTSYAEGDGPQRLAAYFVSQDAIETRQVSEFLATRLPAQMRPAFYVRLAALPMTGNGKVDRAALPSPVLPSTGHPVSFQSGLEAQVAAAWQLALHVESLGAEDNFFDVGGTSLLLIAVRNTLQQQLGRAIPITWLFEATTIRSLAARLDETPLNPPTVTNPAQDNARRQRDAFARMKAARSTVR